VTLSLTAQRVSRDVDVLARAGLDLESFFDEASTSISRALPYSALCIGLMDPTTHLLTGTFKYGSLRGQDEHDHEWGLVEFGQPEATSFGELAHRAVPAAAVSAGSSDKSFRVEEFMVRRYGYTEELRLIVRDRGQVWGGLAFLRESDQGSFDDQDLTFAASLSSSLALGLRTGLLAGLATPTPPTGGANRGGSAVVIVGADNRVHQVSVGTEAVLADLKIQEDGVATDGILGSLVGAARRFAAGDSARPPRCRIRSRSGVWLVLQATPLTAPEGTVGDVVVTIEEARPPEIVPLVVAAFDLTPRERDVTAAVLRGQDTKEIAAEMHLSAYTVQDHLKSVFEKAEVRSRRELIARIFFDQYVPRMGTEIGADGWFASTS
jgi:DNA-binding CsgD family transcriptional regulator